MIDKLKINQKFLPLLVTIGLFVALYVYGSFQYRGFSSPQVFFNLFIDNAFLLITSIGMTLVILSGGIDLSVGAVIAFTTVLSAYLVETNGYSPAIAIPLVLLVGTALGAVMGSIIHFFNVQPFIVTLAGMFFARGMCFVISLDAITISHPFYRAVSLYRIPIPFFERAFISISVVVFLVVLLMALFLAHMTRFGRTIYAIGGNEHSAMLMGLSAARAKILVYTFNGFCSALAGVVFSIDLLSGYGLYTNGLELDAIAAVVIGGTQLTGGVGYVIGTVFGVLIEGLIQTLVIFQGNLSSWWTKIAVGMLTLLFIIIQSAFASRSARKARLSAARAAREEEAAEALTLPGEPAVSK